MLVFFGLVALSFRTNFCSTERQNFLSELAAACSYKRANSAALEFNPTPTTNVRFHMEFEFQMKLS